MAHLHRGEKQHISSPGRSLVILSNSMWSLYNFRRNLITALRRQGVTIELIAPFDGYEAHLVRESVTIRDLTLDRKGMNLFRELTTIFQLFRALTAEKPDAIISFTIKPNIYASLFGIIKGIPVIPNITGLGTSFEKAGVFRAALLTLYRFAFSRHRIVFFQNKENMEYFIRHRIIAPSRARRLPGSGVDVASFTGTSRPGPLRTFLLLGRMLKNKGILEYLRAADIVHRDHPDVVFQLLGSCDVGNPGGILESELRRLCASSHTTYLGATDAVRDFIGRADCIVLPSYYNEGVPRSLLEAAAMGKPIITTNWPGCRDVVDDGVNGYLCRIRDEEDLARAMKAMIALSPESRAAMGQQGRKKIERDFNETTVIHAYQTAITSLFAAKEEHAS